VSARDLLEWNGVLPNLRIVEEEHGETPTFMIVADYGWAERILCGGCYQQDAILILTALEEAVQRREAAKSDVALLRKLVDDWVAKPPPGRRGAYEALARIDRALS
jgi:hypothetical protein